MSDMEDDFMCDDEEDYDLVRLSKINATINACSLTLNRFNDVKKLRFACLYAPKFRM